MRAILVLAILAAPAFADEIIEIHDPIAEPAHPAARVVQPCYSDAAIDSNVWARAWLLVAIDSTGFVTRVKLLNAPGHELDPIAIDQAFTTRFTPALDHGGNAIASQLVWGLEWPSYWWMKAPHLMAPICRGTGPLQLGSMLSSPVYRDCTEPDLARANALPWIYPRAATTNFK